MSLPKDPRQLMVNLMYLVLTALLALNVSAEIINAFFLVDKGISKSNEVVSLTNSSMFKSLEEQAKAYPNFRPLKAKAEKVQGIVDSFVEQVKQLRERLIAESGGYDLEGTDPSLPKRKKDKDVTTRLLVKQGLGDTLQQQILDTRAQLLAILEKPEEQEKIAGNIPLDIVPVPKDKEPATWSFYNFQQMPIAAVLPMLAKFENDARISESAMLNYLMGKTRREIVWDEFTPVVSAPKGYIIRGEDYTSEVFLSARSTQVSNMKILIDGQPYSVKDGKAQFKRKANRLGTESYTVEIQLVNPLTKKRESYKETFKYEVGERSLTVSATKMNAFYVGVDNPVEVSVAGANSNDIRVSVKGGGATISKVNNNNYIVKVKKRTDKCVLTVSAKGFSDSRTFRVKKIPDPIVKLGKKTGGNITKAEFIAHEGVIPDLGDFLFDARCKVLGFELARVPDRDSPQIQKNGGNRFRGKALTIKNAAKRGDSYFFSDIKVMCPGDIVSRDVNSMAFKIK